VQHASTTCLIALALRSVVTNFAAEEIMEISREELINVKELGRHISRKRVNEGLSLREVSKVTGVSPSTLSRIETAKGFMPDAVTLARLCQWLSIPIERVVGTHNSNKTEKLPVVYYPSESTPSIIEAHLRADPDLTPETAQALAELFRVAYEGYKRNVSKS
jgi:transcriptional regulator with XRE-family HTH domain